MNKDLREKQIYQFIIEYVNENGYAPSIREICKGLSIASTSTVQGYIKSLSEKGLLSRKEQKKRAIMPISANKGIINIPILGSIVAGEPLVAFENTEGHFPLPDIYGKQDELFMLKVHGDSMINAGIKENDLIIVKQQSVADSGDIVVAMVDDAATVKTYYIEKSHIRLQPENDNYDPIICKDVKILGKVVGLHRKF